VLGKKIVSFPQFFFFLFSPLSFVSFLMTKGNRGKNMKKGKEEIGENGKSFFTYSTVHR
jgi:hypothetical protein